MVFPDSLNWEKAINVKLEISLIRFAWTWKNTHDHNITSLTSRLLKKFLTDQHLQDSTGLSDEWKHIFKVLREEFLSIRHVLEFYDKGTVS